MATHKIILTTQAEEYERLRLFIIFIFKYLFLPIVIGFIVGLIFRSVGLGWIAGIITLFIIIFRKKIFKKGNNKNIRQKQQHNLFSLKTLIIYGITFTIGFWFSTLVIPFIKTTNFFIIYLLIGLCLELSAKVCQMFLHRKPKITLDKWFILWVLIHSIVIYGILYLINKVTIANQYLFYLIVGFAVAIITHIIWRVMYKK